MSMTTDEHQMLAQLAEAGGHLTYSKQSPAQMRHLAGVARVLHSMGFVTTKVHENHMEASKPVDLVVVALTRKGGEYLAEQS